jgi:hypothetical protein
MSVGNIKHKFNIAIQSNNPVDRAIGILKVAELFETAGIHLSADLSTETSRFLVSEIARDPATTANNTIVATMVENDPVTSEHYQPEKAGDELTRVEEIRGTNFLERTLGSVKDALKSFDKQVAETQPGKKLGNSALSGAHGGGTGYPAMDRFSRFRQGEQAPEPGFTMASDKSGNPSSDEGTTPIYNPKAHATLTEACPTAAGNIPGYEHNPMALSEYFSDKAPVPAIIFIGDHERFVFNNWPVPSPVGLTKYTAVKATDNRDVFTPNYNYSIHGLTNQGWTLLKDIKILNRFDDQEKGPDGVRVEDLLAICADHFSSLERSQGVSHAEHQAHKSIVKALQHLHGLTSLKHLNSTDVSN